MEINLLSDERQDYRGSAEPFAESADLQFEDGSAAEQDDPAAEQVVEKKERGKPIFGKAIRWLVYAAAFLTPLWFLPFAADGLEFDKQILLAVIAGVGLVLYLADVIKSGVFKYKRTSFYWPVLGLVAAGGISVIFSVNRFTSVFGLDARRSFSLVSLISFAILFFLALNTVEDRGKALKNILVSSFALTFLFTALQILGLFIFKGDFAKSSFNTVGNLNSVGMLAAIGLPLFFSFGNSSIGRSMLERIALFAQCLGIVLALFLLVLINWWIVWVVAFSSLLVFAALNSSTDAGNQRMKTFVLPMAVIVLGIFLMLVNFNFPLIKNKLPIEVAPTYGASLEITGSALNQRPLGYGLENFPIAYDQFKPSSIVNTVFYQFRFDNSASGVATFVVEGGILMLLAFLSLLWFYGRELVARIKSSVPDGKDANPVWSAILGLLVAFFLYPINMTLMAVFIFLLALICMSPRAGYAEEPAAVATEGVLDLESNAKFSFLGSVAFIAGLVLALVGWYFMANGYIANVYLGKALASTDKTKSVGWFVKSVNTNGRDARVFRFLSETIIVQLGEDLQNGPQKGESKESYNTRIQSEIESAVKVAQQAEIVDPTDSQNWANLGFVLQNLAGLVSGAEQTAINMYTKSLQRNPADPVTYLRIGTIYLMQAENLKKVLSNPPAGTDSASMRKQLDDALSKAEDNFKKSIALYNNFGQALYNLAVVYDRQGKLPEAIKQFEKLQAANPRDPSTAFQLGLLYYRNGQKDNAFKAWQQAVTLFPKYSNARWYLSLIYEERGDLANALAQVEEIQKLNPDDQTVQQRLDQLKAGKRTIPPEKVLDKQPLNK